MGAGDTEPCDGVPCSGGDGDPERATEQPAKPGRSPRLCDDPPKQFRRRTPEDVFERPAAENREKGWVIRPRGTKDDISERFFRIVVVAGHDIADLSIGFVGPMAATVSEMFGIGIQMPAKQFGVGPGKRPIQFVAIAVACHAA